MDRWFLPLPLFASLWTAAASGEMVDATVADPDVHRVVLENEFVRVFEARASAGATSPMHAHPPFVFISLGKARFRLTRPDGSKVLLDHSPGMVAWVPGTQHSWELLVGELHAVGVEIKSAQEPGEPPAVQRRADDSTVVDPDVHRVLFENPHVRVFEARASHPRSSPMHSHPAAVLVSLDWVRVKLTLPDGNTLVHDYSPGQVLWFPEGGTHSWETIAGGGRLIAVEVKAAAAARRK